MATPTDTVRRSYEALGQAKVPAVISILDEHVECTEGERFPYGGGAWYTSQAVRKFGNERIFRCLITSNNLGEF